MAAVSHVSLSIKNSSTANSKDVTVTGELTFDSSDIGRRYHLAIKLFGEDKPGDNLPASDTPGDDELYTFRFFVGGFIFWLPYKSITATAAGSHSFTETRTVSSATLDEDSGNVFISLPDINSPSLYFPRLDEVYAKVTLSAAPSSSIARSNTVTGFFH